MDYTWEIVEYNYQLTYIKTISYWYNIYILITPKCFPTEKYDLFHSCVTENWKTCDLAQFRWPVIEISLVD